MMNWVAPGTKQPWPNLGHYLGLYLKGLRKSQRGLVSVTAEIQTRHLLNMWDVTARVNLFRTFANSIGPLMSITSRETLTDQVTDRRLVFWYVRTWNMCLLWMKRANAFKISVLINHTALHHLPGDGNLQLPGYKPQISQLTDQFVHDLANYNCQGIK